MLRGQIDRCRGRYLYGWAIPKTSDSNCTISITDLSGQEIVSTLASVVRADLAGLVGERTDFGFVIGVPLSAPGGVFRVYADSEEMAGSPIHLDDSIFDGEITIQDGIVSGWLSNRGRKPVAELVQLFDQEGRVVLTLTASPDAGDVDPLFRPARFAAPLPSCYFGATEICLTGKIRGFPFARGFGYTRLGGYLDAVTLTRCAGWLFSPDAPDRRFDLEVYVNGTLAGAGVTHLPRLDVGMQYPGAENCGFDFELSPVTDSDAGLAHVSIRLADTAGDLFSGPFLLGPRVHAANTALAALGAAQHLPHTEYAMLRNAMAEWIAALRSREDSFRISTRSLPRQDDSIRRIAIVIPVYRDLEATRVCLDSVFRVRREGRDSVIIVNDNPAEPAMAVLVGRYGHLPDVYILSNARNEGFVGAANRAMEFARTGDVLLLNSDTELFPGALDEMYRVLHVEPDIGTVTALSSNATLFSYPHPEMAPAELTDTDWASLAAVALRENAGRNVDIPTAHGFCMLIRRAVLDEIHVFDTCFGRGYGEENDYSLRAADRGWRHVLAGGALVRHEESLSFGADTAPLKAANLKLLGSRYPEYHARIALFQAADPVRAIRWPLDFHRIRQVARASGGVDLVIDNWMDGGTKWAVADIDSVVNPGRKKSLRLNASGSGRITLTLDGLALRAAFDASDMNDLFGGLATLALNRVVVHQLLGFNRDFIDRLNMFTADRPAIFHVHDFYYACPRVTMIDATGSFCHEAPPDRCVRCIELGGTHEAHRLESLSPVEHRALFQDVLARADRVVAPSNDTAQRLAALLPGHEPAVLLHPQNGIAFPRTVRTGTTTDICIIGAIGDHKGAKALLALARYARLNHPDLMFHLVGFSAVDDILKTVGNVTVTGKYIREDLPELIAATQAKIALFLHEWPETFSYTLTEAVSQGLIPVVPDIGAPAERVRRAGFGVVFPFPSDAAGVIGVLQGVADGTVPFSHAGASPMNFATPESVAGLRKAYGMEEHVPPPQAAARSAKAGESTRSLPRGRKEEKREVPVVTRARRR